MTSLAFQHRKRPFTVHGDPRVDYSGGDASCWLWLGRTTAGGYGLRKNHYVHRLAWQEANGRAVPDGLHVMHSCDTPNCVNPAHLSVGTQKDNAQDALAKGRLDLSGLQRRGEWTHCKRGHEFTEANTYRYPDGTRDCRICRKARNARHSAKRRLEAEAFVLSAENYASREDPEQKFRLYTLTALDESPRLLATCATSEAVGVTICTLADEGEFERAAVGVMDAQGETGKKWLLNPYDGRA